MKELKAVRGERRGARNKIRQHARNEKGEVLCYACRKSGHIARDCLMGEGQGNKSNAPPTYGPAPQRNRSSTPNDQSREEITK